jgi:hypothetical protein
MAGEAMRLLHVRYVNHLELYTHRRATLYCA